ncbi:sugar phosphate isomerase/epimerase family protein [Alicyclobacillus shizuokensis]|uniref:sugar phosphate isomerase/epimerase family protein n=1 Tax=Alicyclobacillus shizuokensis TaxID=392014 RepID=UPI0008349731|nr:sugar phosphate isomerase/epimerase family protein [Alicyclobacillus shizuokensis]MCL6625751.1 sugar phosphate isomerase/epimerase [Alicyclobacillus shizuokensis]
MKFAVQENLVPGSTFQEKVDNLQSLGYDGVELRGDGLAGRVGEIRRALEDSGVSATCVCGGYKFGLLFPDKGERAQARDQIRTLLSLAAEVRAQGLILVPIFGPPRLPDLSPWRTSEQLEEELLVEQLGELAEYAGTQGTQLILEPLNRYETHFVRRIEQAVQLCQRVASPHMTVLADVFHMNIEEASIPDALRGAKSWLGYVHLADSNRLLPGMGHIDFAAVFAALSEIAYGGWMSLECGVPEGGGEALGQSLRFMQSLLPNE